MVQNRHQFDCVDAPLTPEQQAVMLDLLWKAIAKEGYENMAVKLEAIIGEDEPEQQMLEERLRRHAETFADVRKKYKGMRFSLTEAIVVLYKEMHNLTNPEIGAILGIGNPRQILLRIKYKFSRP